MIDTIKWHHISSRPTEAMDGFLVTCSCGWKSEFHAAPAGLDNWVSAQNAAEEDRKAHARNVAPENAIWTGGPIYVRPSDYPADHFINQRP